MKKVLLAGCLVAVSAAVTAQCGKTVTWMSAKTEFLDSNGRVDNVKIQPTKILTTPTHITVTIDEGGGDIIQGEIRDLACDWKDAFKNGKTSFKSLMAKSNGETREVTISIEAVDGQIVMIVEVEQMQGKKMRMLVDSYKEGK